jgi:hypothetical protein
MKDKLPSYIEIILQTGGNYPAYDDGEVSDMDDDYTENGGYSASDCGNYQGGGEDRARDVSREDLEAMKRMVHEMLRNPELLRMPHLYSGNLGVASSSHDESMTKACAAVVSQVSPSSVPMECETALMLVAPHAATRMTMPMSSYFCQECNTSPTLMQTVPRFPPLPFCPWNDHLVPVNLLDLDCAARFEQNYR